MICVNSVKVTPESVTLKAGQWYYNARAEVCPPDAECRSVRWYSNNTGVATVNATTGYIYAVKAGSAKIYAEATDGSGEKDYITVNVTSGPIYVDSVTLSRTSISLEEGDSYTLYANVFPSNADNRTIAWSSSNENIAEVSNGTITAKTAGTAYIYARATDGSEKYAQCQVTVTEEVLVTSVSVSPARKTMTVGDTAYLHEIVCPPDADNKEVVWSSSDLSVVTVNYSNGFIMAVKEGVANVYATAADGSGRSGVCEITVYPTVRVQSVEISTEIPETMHVGDVMTLQATVCPMNATNQIITWSSSNEEVAEVGMYTGELIAKSVGTVTITATSADGRHTDCCILEVSYCGDNNFRDITEHNMVLLNDGYYECSICKYRVKSPALQDKDVLNKSDYLSIVSLYHDYICIVEKYPIYAEKLLAMIDAIRGLPDNKYKYEYCDSNGVYVPEYNIEFGRVRMYINVNQGSCLFEWQLMNVLFPLIGAMIPPPYSYMFSLVSGLLMQEHPGAEGFTGSEILIEYTKDYLVKKKIIPTAVSNAISILMAYDSIVNGTSCTENCYNITIDIMSDDEIYDLHQVSYHFSDGAETLGRYSEHNMNGTGDVLTGVSYYDYVNDREYDIYP